MKTRIVLITVLALVAGFVIGIKLSEVLGIVGVFRFGHAIGIRYLSIYLAIGAAVLANLVDARIRRKSKQLDE